MLVLAGFISAHARIGELEEISAANIEHLDKIAEITLSDTPMLEDRIVWTPDGESLAIVTTHEVLLYRVPDLNEDPVTLFESERQLTRIAFTTDFELMAVSSGMQNGVNPILSDTRISVIELATGALVAEFQTEEIAIAMTFTANDTQLITVYSPTYNFGVWDIQQSTLVEHHETEQPGWPWMLGATFTTDGTLVALGSGSTSNQQTIWNTQTGELIAQGNGYSSQLTFSPDNTVLAGASRYGGWTQLWQIDTVDEGPIIEFASHYTLAADFSADDSVFAQILTPVTISDSYKIQFVDPETGQEQHRLIITEEASIDTGGMDLIFSPDGQRLVIYNANTGIHLWGIASSS